MIWKYEIRKVSEGYYSQREYQLMSPETSGNLAADLREDRCFGEAAYFAGRAREGTQWVCLACDSGFTAFARLPKKARRRVKPGDRKAIENGRIVSVYACIY